jgi:hypothetical protein
VQVDGLVWHINVWWLFADRWLFFGHLERLAGVEGELAGVKSDDGVVLARLRAV